MSDKVKIWGSRLQAMINPLGQKKRPLAEMRIGVPYLAHDLATTSCQE